MRDPNEGTAFAADCYSIIDNIGIRHAAIALEEPREFVAWAMSIDGVGLVDCLEFACLSHVPSNRILRLNPVIPEMSVVGTRAKSLTRGESRIRYAHHGEGRCAAESGPSKHVGLLVTTEATDG